MSTEVLGSLSFATTPSVTGFNTVLNTGGVPSLQADITANRPAAGQVGRLFIDSTLNILYYDTGSAWSAIGASTTYTGTTNQIDVIGTVLSLAADAVLPGTGGFVPPTGTTAQRSGTPVTGVERYNSTLGYTETYNGAWLPQGRVLQVVSGAIGQTSGTSAIPNDNTIPQITEGTAIWSTSFTPLSTASRIVITFSITHSNATATNPNVLSVFAGATMVGAVMDRVAANNGAGVMMFHGAIALASTATITIQARLGGQGGTTWYCNQTSGATLGGSALSSYTITEIL